MLTEVFGPQTIPDTWQATTTGSKPEESDWVYVPGWAPDLGIYPLVDTSPDFERHERMCLLDALRNLEDEVEQIENILGLPHDNLDGTTNGSLPSTIKLCGDIVERLNLRMRNIHKALDDADDMLLS